MADFEEMKNAYRRAFTEDDNGFAMPEETVYTPNAIFKPTSNDVGLALCQLVGEDPARIMAIRVEAIIGELPTVMVHRVVKKPD